MYFDFKSLFKYLLEGFGVALAAFYIPRKTINFNEILMISLTAAATFALLDAFAPTIGKGARQGSGFGIGYNLSTGNMSAPKFPEFPEIPEGFQDVTDNTELSSVENFEGDFEGDDEEYGYAGDYSGEGAGEVFS